MSDSEVCKKILNYWHIMNIMTQNEHPFADVYDYTNKKKKLMKSSRSPDDTVFVKLAITEKDLTSDKIEEIIRNECREYTARFGKEFKQYGSIDIYIGDVLRDAVLDSMIEAFGRKKEDNETIEHTGSRIAAGVFSVTAEGDYVEGSVSPSPLLWALSTVVENHYKSGDKLSIKDYGLLKNGFDNDWKVKPHTIKEMGEGIVKPLRFPDDNRKDEDKMPYVLCFSVTCKKKETSDEDADPPMLSMAFYAEDLKRCAESIDDDMPQHLRSYILTNSNRTERPAQSVDLVKGTRADLYGNFDRILDVNNAPLGKWPSKYYPALMQQMAINIEIDRRDNPIFSVNGPPGTGKTTLLKEVIVNNITERARLICDYTKSKAPDELFETHNFRGGKGRNGRYDEFTPYWASFKPEYDSINDYGIVVASCNNAAVENISKELPVDEFTKAFEETKEEESPLREVFGMFSPEHTDLRNPIFYMPKVENEKPDVLEDEKDVYFSVYASELLHNKAWGLLAAPMGKKTNIRKFCYAVLNNYIIAFNRITSEKSNNYHDYLKDFKRAKKGFAEQYRRVAELKEEISGRIKQERALMRDIDKIEAARKKLGEYDYEKEFSMIEARLDAMRDYPTAKDIEKLRAEHMKHLIRQSDLKSEIDQLRFDYDRYSSEANKKRLLFKSKQEEAAQKAAECSRKIKEAEGRCDLEKKIVAELEAEINNKSRKISAKNKLEEDYRRLDDEYKQMEYYASKQIDNWKKTDGRQEWNAINSSFIDDYLDKDGGGSRKTNNAELWFTQQYDREREKLFYHALQVQKYFLLSSKNCKYNLTTLAQCWQVMNGKVEGVYTRVNFSSADKHDFMPSLLQTLFLLVPVVSSTFASIGSMFKYAFEPGIIGTLIVDEAGQATPECAIGALYRSRRAMIVGDPKQVEPVVTGELQLLRDSYRDEDLIPYKDKSLSVQVFADMLNRFGTVLSGTDEIGNYIDTWVGCPLVIHRRCISPMFDISNELSYDNIMINEARAKNGTYVFESSRWLDITGKERGNKNHYVEAQGAAVAGLIIKAFSERRERPSIYIISPFTTVVNGLKAEVKKELKGSAVDLDTKEAINDWIGKGIGTVHTFQGKEADEVFFVLGCDQSSVPAVKWVNANIVNVAVTRAKQRIYIVGDHRLWADNSNVKVAQNHLPVEKCDNSDGAASTPEL